MSYAAQEIQPANFLATWARELKHSALQDMLVDGSRPGILSLALGLPAAELFPVEEYSEAVSYVLRTDPRALQYGPPYGPLKKHIVALMAKLQCGKFGGICDHDGAAEIEVGHLT